MFSSVGIASATSFLDLSALDSDAQGQPTSVNASGQVTGFLSSNSHAFLYTGGSAGSLADIYSVTSNSGIGSAINDAGQIAAASVAKAILYSGGTAGTAQTLTLSGSVLRAYAIDAAGEVGGGVPSGSNKPFLYSGGTTYAMPTISGSSAGVVSGLNPSGGYAAGFNEWTPGSPTPNSHYATVWTYSVSGGTLTANVTSLYPYLSVARPTMNTSFALAVNNSGLVVGEVQTAAEGNSGANASANNDTYLYNPTGEQVTYLSDLGLRFALQTTTYITGGYGNLINDAGQVVGEEQVGGVWHAAIWDATNGLRDLNTVYAGLLATAAPGFVLNAATAINDSGYIVGYGTDSASHTSQIFLINTNTVPEPSTLLLTVTGFVGLTAYAWRKRK
jgi:hypothetical protein